MEQNGPTHRNDKASNKDEKNGQENSGDGAVRERSRTHEDKNSVFRENDGNPPIQKVQQISRKDGFMKKIRKGQPIKNKLKNFTVMYLNIRGIKSKLRSLINIVEEIQPTIICITETHLSDDENLEIEGYKPLRNNRDKDGGGVLIAIHEKLAHIATIVDEKKEVEESLWVVIVNTKIAIRVALVYADHRDRSMRSCDIGGGRDPFWRWRQDRR